VNKAGLFIVLAWLAVSLVVAPRIDMYQFTSLAGKDVSDIPFYIKFLGEGRSIISNLSILQADRYLHGGVYHAEEGHGLVGSPLEEAYEMSDGEDLERHEKGHPEPGRFNILMRVSEEVEVTEHIHLGDEEAREIVPWLYYSARIDPHNVLAYTLAGYWIVDRMGKVDEGIDFLKEGLKNNPGSWEIYAELGRIYYVHGKNYGTAVKYLKEAQALLDKVPHDRFQERYVLSFLGFSYEAMGQDEKAKAVFRKLSDLFPESAELREKAGGEVRR